jgi:hypothetical protein
VRGEGQNKGPFSTFVALPTWTREPEFPLVKGLSKAPITSVDQTPMRFMRFEMMKHMQISNLINPDPEVMPSDPRWTLIEGRTLGERFPAVEAADEPNEPPLPVDDGQERFPFAPNPDLPPPPGALGAADMVLAGAFTEPAAPPRAPLPEVPGDLELEARVATDGLGWLADFQCPTDLRPSRKSCPKSHRPRHRPQKRSPSRRRGPRNKRHPCQFRWPSAS